MTTWLEINKKNIIHNLKAFRKIIGEKKLLMPVIKSNAYGHGLIEIARLIDGSKLIDKIAVVNSDEALCLVNNKIKTPIIILSYWSNEHVAKLIKHNCEFTVYDIKQARYLNQLRKKIKIHLKVDTGTTRLGQLEKNFISFVKKIQSFPYLQIESVFTHYANSEEDNEFTKQQNFKLRSIKKNLELLNIHTKYHAACSAAVLSNTDNHLDGMRLGLSFYGYWPSPQTKIYAAKKYPWLKLKPALIWKAQIIQIKEIPKNNFIGYGCTYKTTRTTKIAVLPVGYYEGYNRLLSNQSLVLVKNKLCKVVGRVCMNLTMVDVTDIKNVKSGDEVILMNRKITPDYLAEKCNSINYEFIARINPLLPRIYK
ncbi:MAG: alanine racemase [Patescibacteria group bacterium]